MRWPFTRACQGKGLPRSPPGASEVPSGFPGFEKLPNLSTSDCFPLDFGELPKPDKPLQGPQDNAGQAKTSTFPRQARGKYTFGPHVARLRWPFTPACPGKKPSQVSLKRFRSGLGSSQVSPRRCRSALGLPRLWKFPSLSTSFCYPSDFGELPKSENPGFRNRIVRVLAMDFARACDGRLSRNARNGI